MSFINRDFFEISEETRRRETAVTLETHEYIATYFLSSFFLAFELSWITSDQRVVGLGLLKSCLMALAKTSALPLQIGIIRQ